MNTLSEVPSGVLCEVTIPGGHVQLVRQAAGIQGRWHEHPADAWETVPARLLVPDAADFAVLTIPAERLDMQQLITQLKPRLTGLSRRMRRHLQASQDEEG